LLKYLHYYRLVTRTSLQKLVCHIEFVRTPTRNTSHQRTQIARNRCEIRYLCCHICT